MGLAACLFSFVAALARPGTAQELGRPLGGHLALPSAGDERHYSMRQWTVDGGLPHTAVTCVTQTRDGFLWIGTHAGLARFDGVRIRTYDLVEVAGLSDKRIRSLYEDRLRRLWIGTSLGEVCVYEEGRFRRVGPERGLEGPVRSILQDDAGTVWFGVDGLARWEEGRMLRTDLPGAEGAPVRVLLLDRTGSLWLGGDQGVARRVGATFEEVLRGPVRGGWRGADGSVRFLRDHDVVVGAPGGSYRLVPHDAVVGPVGGVALDADGRAWTASEQGVLLLERSGERFAVAPLEGPLGSQSASDVYFDTEGNVWIATETLGLVRLQRRAFVRRGAGPITGLWGGGDGSVWYSDSEFWVRPLGAPDGPGGAPAPEFRSFLALAADPAGALWCGRVDGLWQGPPEHLQRHPRITSKVTSVHVAASGVAWVGTRGAIWCLDGRSTRTLYTEQDEDVTAFVESPDGELWFSSPSHLGRVEEDGLQLYCLPEHGFRTEPRALLFASDGRLWFTSYGGGLHSFQSGKFTSLGIADGLPDDALGGLLESDGALWINSNRGVFRLSLDEVARYQADLSSFLSCQLLPTGKGSGDGCARATDGNLLFPTIDGIVSIDPASHRPNTAPPRVLVERVHTEEGTWFGVEDLRLPPGTRRVTIDFNAPSFLQPSLIRFRHRLLGHRDDWSDEGFLRSVHYANLPPGEYTFEVKSRNSDGVSSVEPARLSLVVRPRFYQAAWFRLLLAGGALLAVGLGHNWRTRLMRRRTERLESEIHDHERIEEALRESEQRYRGAYETAPLAFVLWDRAGRIKDWNQRAEQIFGWTREEVLGQSFLQFLNPEGGRPTRDELAASLLDGTLPRHLVSSSHSKEGRAILCEWNHSVVHGSDGEVSGAVSLGTDITQQRMAEDMLVDLRRRFVRAEEAERRRIARELHDDLTQRVAAASLELAVASEHLEGASPDVQASFQEVKESLDEITRDVHALSRQLHPSVLEDLGLERALRSECQRRSKNSPTRFELHCDPLPNLDRDQSIGLFRIAQEALRNAERHAGASSVAVRMTVDGAELSLEVEDRGRGFQHAGVGAGLGLSSMEERARLLKGSFRVASRPGEGTTVSVRVPVDRGH